MTILISKKLINDLINKYGVSCELELESSKTINFKGVINNFNNFNDSNNSKTDFLLTNPCENNFVNLIIAEPAILKKIKPGLIIKCRNTLCQDISCQDISRQDTSCQDISCQDVSYLNIENINYQILKYKKYYLADQLYYISALLTMI